MNLGVARLEGAWGKVFPAGKLVQDARSALEARQGELDARKSVWRKRMNILRAVLTGFFFLKWTVANGGIVWATIGAGIVWFVSRALLWAVPLASRSQAAARDTAERALADATHRDIDRFLSSSGLGPYRWVLQHGRTLGVFSESGHLYHFGPASDHQHLLLRIGEAVRQLAVTNKSTVQETSVSTTTHGRRNVYGITENWSVMGSGTSRTRTTTTATTRDAYTLEVQFMMNAFEPPRWFTVPFDANRQEAENWKLMIERAGKPAA